MRLCWLENAKLSQCVSIPLLAQFQRSDVQVQGTAGGQANAMIHIHFSFSLSHPHLPCFSLSLPIADGFLILKAFLTSIRTQYDRENLQKLTVLSLLESNWFLCTVQFQLYVNTNTAHTTCRSAFMPVCIQTYTFRPGLWPFVETWRGFCHTPYIMNERGVFWVDCSTLMVRRTLFSHRICGWGIISPTTQPALQYTPTHPSRSCSFFFTPKALLSISPYISRFVLVHSGGSGSDTP